MARTWMFATARTTLWLMTIFLAMGRYDHFDKYVEEKGGPANIEVA